MSSRGGPREDQEAGEQAEEAAVHDLLATNAQVEDLDPSYTGATAMAIVPLPLPPAAEARALLHHLLEHGDVVGRDTAGRTIVKLAVDDWLLEKLMTFDAEAAELEPEPDEEDGPPVVIEFVRPKMVGRRRALAPGCVG
jgi:hypothetical protein